MLVVTGVACAKRHEAKPVTEGRDAEANDVGVPAKADAAAKGERACGYVDRNGTLVIPRRFDLAGEFSSGLAAVTVDLKAGFVDGKGNYAIASIFDAAKEVRQGLAAACVKGKGWGFVDTKGAWVIPPRFSWADSFSEGAAVVKDDGEIEYACEDDAIRGIPPGDDCEKDFGNDEDKPGSYHLIDRSGRRLTAKGYHGITRVSDGMAAVLWKNRWGYVDRKGKEVIRPVFVRAKPFGEGWAAVWLPDRRDQDFGDGKWGFIDKQGKFKVPGKYGASEVGVFSQGLVAMEGLPIKALYGSPIGRACLASQGQTADDLRDSPDAQAECAAYMDKNGKFRIAVPFCALDDVYAGERTPQDFVGEYAELVMQEPLSVYPFKCVPALTPDVRLFINRQGEFVSPSFVLASRAPEGLAPSCGHRRNGHDVNPLIGTQ